MTIRYKCDTCGSTLNIKEELAGSQGKCPKCKTSFTVPQPSTAAVKETPASERAAVGRRKPAVATVKKSRQPAGEDFDPLAVLMGDDVGGGASSSPGRKRKPSPPPMSDDELPSDLELDLEMADAADDDPPRGRKAKKRKRVQFDSDDDFDAEPAGSASATAGAMLSGGASAGAKDLLTRTMEESRARASRIEEDVPQQRGPSVMDYVREFGPKGAAVVGGLAIVVVGLYFLANAMYGGGMPLPELGRVYGTVTLDGKPLEGATVRFAPAERGQTIGESTRQHLRASTAVTDEDGYYDLYYTEDVRGAAATEHRVIITKVGPDGRLMTPFEYSDYSMEKRTVEAGSQEIDFDLTSDPRPQPAGGGR